MGKFNNFNICGLGMSTLDLLQIVDSFPEKEGVTQILESRLMGGGPVPTAICTAARLGASVSVIDRIGEDWIGRQISKEYSACSVNTDHLILEDGKTTTLATILVRKEDGERHILFSPGSFTPLDESEIPLSILGRESLLHLNGRHWPACLFAARSTRESGGLVSFDGGAHRYDDKFTELLRCTDIAIVARDFAEKLTSSTDVDDQLAALRGFGVSVAGVTDGARGSWFSTSEDGDFHQDAFPANPVVDTTGCGDVFHGAFLFGHSQGWPPRQSARLASGAAALNATALGGRGNLPTYEQAMTFIEELKEH